MRRVIKAEQRWLQTVRREMAIYSKRKHFMHWKRFLGMELLEKDRNRRTKIEVLSVFKGIYENGLQKLDMANAAWKEKEMRRLMEVLKTERDERRKEKRAMRMDEMRKMKDCWGMMKRFVEERKRVRNDEFLSLGEQQDYFEIGVIQAKMHRF